MKLCEHFMKKLIVFCLLVGVVLLSGAPPVAAANVNIPDANLRKAINSALGANRAATAVVTEAEMKTLTSLSASSVSDLTGLEKATNLTRLGLSGSFTDISAVSGLTNLTTLTLDSSYVFSDISAVSSLTNLTTLNMRGYFPNISAVSRLTNLTTLTLYGPFTNLSALSKLTNLTSLDLWGSFTDISALSSLTNLTTLTLRGRFTDISSLSSLTNLTSLNMRQIPGSSTLTCTAIGQWAEFGSDGNPISDSSIGPEVARVMETRISNISALSGLTNLTYLDLTGHNITDISALSGLTNLTHLYLGDAGRVDHTAGTSLGQTANFRQQTVDCGPLRDPVANSVSNISALSGLTNLTHLDLADNNVSDISALSGLTNLTRLNLEWNNVSDLSPLVSNTGFGTGDSVNLYGNGPLSYPSIYTHTPALKARGAGVNNVVNRVPTSLTKVSGDAQTGVTSTALANPFVVEVKDGTTWVTWDIQTQTSTRVPAPVVFAGVPVTFAVTGGGGTLSATSVATDANGRAQVTLTPGATAATQTVTATVTHAGRTLTQTFTATANRHPTFTSAATFSVTENTPATTAVGTVVATDADSQDSVTGYTLSGADSATFSITNAGVLTFNASPDYDTPGDLVSTDPANAAGNNEYIIVVTATSGSGARQLTATQTLTITVTDVNEAPGQPAPPTVATVAATPTSLSVNWTAATNTGPAITYNLRYRKSSEVSWTRATYADDAISTTLTGLAPGTSYEVQVLAKNSEGDGPWSESGTGTTAYQAEDIDRSGDVDINDLVSVISNFGSASPGNNDVDGDGNVDADDIRAVFAALLAANAGAPAHLTHTAKTLQDYVRQVEQRGMLDANFRQGLVVLEALLEPFLLPDETALLRNYPNPFNPETWIPYQLSKPADVTFSIYSVNGRLVRTLSLGYQAAGVYRHRSRAAYWDGRNAHGEPVASGVYFYTLTAGEFIATGKMLIRK